MSDLLENELVRKYFSCDTESPHGHCDLDDIKYTCKADLALRVLAAMQAPIKKGERYLFLAFSQWIENDAGEYTGFHPKELRLPDKFQKPEHKHEWVCGCGLRCKHDCVCCGDPKPAPKDNSMHDRNCQKDTDHKGPCIDEPTKEFECPLHGLDRDEKLCTCTSKPDPVEEKIALIVAPFVRGGDELETELRELVELVRTRGQQ